MTPCTWTEDEDGLWNTTCEEIFQTIDGTPSENSFRFCPYCGKPLEEVKLTESEKEESKP